MCYSILSFDETNTSLADQSQKNVPGTESNTYIIYNNSTQGILNKKSFDIYDYSHVSPEPSEKKKKIVFKNKKIHSQKKPSLLLDIDVKPCNTRLLHGPEENKEHNNDITLSEDK